MRYAVWLLSLPEAQKAPPKERKQLHALQLVKFEVFKTKIYVLDSCVVLLSLESQKDGPSKCPIKMPLRNSGFCGIKSQAEQKTDIGHLFCCSFLSYNRRLSLFCCLCGVLASESKSIFALAARMALYSPPSLASQTLTIHSV